VTPGFLMLSGSFTVRRKTAKKRMAAKLREIKTELRRRMHQPIPLVGASLRQVLTGYYQYHAIPGNLDRLSVFRRRLRRLWATILRRRSQRGRTGWQRLGPLLDRWLPNPRVLHPYPKERFAARHPR
jgi:RNA-directed DNA polymerase